MRASVCDAAPDLTDWSLEKQEQRATPECFSRSTSCPPGLLAPRVLLVALAGRLVETGGLLPLPAAERVRECYAAMLKGGSGSLEAA